MFTGIIQEKGIITDRNKDKNLSFSVKSKRILENKKIGDSICVNGICVTITNINNDVFDFDAMPETISTTNIDELEKGSEVNLEPALTLNQGLDGHLIQGHVDTTGEVQDLTDNSDQVRLTIKYPKEISQYLAFKGSVTLNGVSLTISDLRTDTFSVDLIPHTLKATNLNKIKKGDKVNIEIDLIARYLKTLLDTKEKETKYEYLKERGFL